MFKTKTIIDIKSNKQLDEIEQDSLYQDNMKFTQKNKIFALKSISCFVKNPQILI